MTIRHLAPLAAALVTAALSTACGGGGTCAEGATKNADTGICIKLPADFKMDEKASKSGDSSSIHVKNAKFDMFTIWIEKPGDLAQQAKAVAGMAGSDLKLVASGDTSPSKGKFFHFHNGPKNYDFAVTLIPGKEHFYRCEIQNTPPEVAKGMVEACKTLSGP